MFEGTWCTYIRLQTDRAEGGTAGLQRRYGTSLGWNKGRPDHSSEPPCVWGNTSTDTTPPQTTTLWGTRKNKMETDVTHCGHRNCPRNARFAFDVTKHKFELEYMAPNIFGGTFRLWSSHLSEVSPDIQCRGPLQIWDAHTLQLSCQITVSSFEPASVLRQKLLVDPL